MDVSNALDQLAKSITKNKSSKSEKAKAIYLWIANNITYDLELRLSRELQKEFYISEENVIRKVLHRKKALCGGFAFLFRELCNRANIEAKSIHGFTKLATTNKTPNHSWNAVKLNGKWHLLDITWSVSNGQSKNPDTFWYLTSPEIFIKSHYPKDIYWALLPNPPKLSSFIVKS